MSSENVEAVSVRDLVRRRRGDDADSWHLALVQRGEVWDQVRMRYLLDSLLNGYPIGSLLVCKVTGRSRVIRLEAGQRGVTETDHDSLQLLDGQQRINALFSMFTPEGRYGRFYLHMTARRDPPGGPVTSRRARAESVRYIHWKEEPETVKVPQRDRHIDLSRWYGWAEGDQRNAVDEAVQKLACGPAETVTLLNAIDSEFADRLEDAEVEIARHRLCRLLEVWQEPAIPVQYLSLGSPPDVLEVFTRINRAGVQVAGEDLFFAAVKTLWPEAEQAMAHVVKLLGPPEDSTQVTPVVGRLGALRTLARLAARAGGQADIVPLTVDRLNGARGESVIDGIRMLSDTNSVPLRRMAATLHAVMRSSTLGFGLYSVDERLWDDVLSWGAVNRRAENPDWLREQMAPIDSYLLGATCFRYPSLLRDPFSRLAMTEALAAGMSTEAFPAQRIAEVSRTLIPDLREGRARIRGSSNEDERLWLADANASLFLSMLQKIPYRPQRDVFDWDHIYPQAKASLMSLPGRGGKGRRHHRYRRFVASAGNLWGLDAGANRAARDRLPSEKFKLIETWPEGRPSPVWPRERWWLTDDEIKDLGDVGRELQAGSDVEPAMERFYGLVRARAIRMTDEVFRLLPEAKLFSRDSSVAGAEPIRPELKIAEALGIQLLEQVQAERAAGSPDRPDERVEQVLRLADERGSGPALRSFVTCALGLGLQVRGYQWTLTITPRSTKTIALISMSPRQDGLVSTWVAPWAFAIHFPAVAPERFDESLGGVRGSSLSVREIDDLCDRVKQLLRPQPPAVGVATAESGS